MASSQPQEAATEPIFPPSTTSDSYAHEDANVSDHVNAPDTPTPRSWRFWMVFASMCLVSLSTSLDSTIITTALPTITKSIGGEDQYVWIGNSFLLASTVVQPLVGQLADIFGRRWPMLISVALFMLGAGIAGGANGVSMLIGGRTVQGLGSGGIFVLLDIITCDLVPLRERGQFLALVLSTGAVGSTVGPIIGGALAEANWRWVFYLSLPTAGTAGFALIFFLHVTHVPESTWKAALARIDYFGTLLFIASITAVLLGLILGGTTYPWGSYHVIVPLVLGFLGWAVFHLYEMSPLCRVPSVPPRLFSNRTSFVGFFLAFDSGMLLMWTVIFLPVYFQGVLATTPLRSGVNMLPLSIFLVPFGMVAGGVMSKTGQYKPLHWIGFGVVAIGTGLFSILNAHSSKAAWACFQIIAAIGLGFIMTTLLPAIQAALPEADQAKTTSIFSFMRSFGFVWGITVPAIVFNGRFDHFLGQISDAQTRSALANGGAYALASGGYVQSLAPDIRAEVVTVYSLALKTVWEVAVAFSLFGFLLIIIEKRIDLRIDLETKYGLQDKDVTRSPESGGDERNRNEVKEPKQDGKQSLPLIE